MPIEPKRLFISFGVFAFPILIVMWSLKCNKKRKMAILRFLLHFIFGTISLPQTKRTITLPIRQNYGSYHTK